MFTVKILWGECSELRELEPCEYTFDTLAEVNAFFLGLMEMDGYAGWECINSDEVSAWSKADEE